MSSKVAMCNFALSKIGGKTITSLSDSTKEASLCNTFFDIVVKWVIAEGPWTCTIGYANLAATTTASTSIYEFLYEYQLPTNCVTLLEILDAKDNDEEYIKVGSKIWTDMTEIKIIYTKNLTDPEQFDANLEQAIVARLALELSRPLTGLQGLYDSLAKEYEVLVAQGLNRDGMQGSNVYIRSDDLNEVR